MNYCVHWVGKEKTQNGKCQVAILISLGDQRSFSFPWLVEGYETWNTSDFIVLILETSGNYKRGR